MDISIRDCIKNETSGFAVAEMAYYFKKIFSLEAGEGGDAGQADVKLRIVSDEGGNDRIIIRLGGGKADIAANGDAALLIAVYRLFSEFGAVFARPGRENEVLPRLSASDWRAGELSIDETADFRHRGVCIEGADSYENIVDFIDWLPKIKMNSFFIQFENPYPFLKRWYEHELNPCAEKEEFNADIAQAQSDRIDDEMKKRGLSHHRVGHGWTGEVLGYSSRFGWESGLSLTEDKKPLAAELNGERALYGGAPILTSLCFSNPEAGRRMIEIIVSYARRRRDVDYLHVWLSDARNNICECEDCRKELPSDQYVRLLNGLDAALTAEGLDTKICFLLYHELLFPPKFETLKNPERFTMMFAPITRTFEKSYADVDYERGVPEPPKYRRNRMVMPNSLEENLSYLFAWKKVFQGDSFVYDYPLGRAHYGDLGYMGISRVISRDLKFLNKLELNGYISCQELRAGFPHYFPNYCMGELLWDQSKDYERLKERYFEALCGEEWGKAVSYLENLSSCSSCDYFNGIGARLNPGLSENYRAAGSLAGDFLPVIEANVSRLTGAQKEAWRQLSFHRRYVIGASRALELLSRGAVSEAQRQWSETLDFIRNAEPLFQKSFDVYRVTEVAKNYAGLLP